MFWALVALFKGSKSIWLIALEFIMFDRCLSLDEEGAG